VQSLAPLMRGRPLVLNGGLRDAAGVAQILDAEGGVIDGVMLGREAYHRPAVLAELHALMVARGRWPEEGWRAPTPAELVERMIAYAEREMAAGEALVNITRHMLGLLTHTPGAREFRRLLSEGARDRAAGVAPLLQARDLAARCA
jgi:tRNA-dihydrouridine synthase A